MTENHPSFLLRLSPKYWLHTQLDQMKSEDGFPYTTYWQSLQPFFYYYKKLWFLSYLSTKVLFFLYKTKTLLTGEMLEIPNLEKHEMKLLKMHMKKCPKIPKMPHMLSWANSKQHLTVLYGIWIDRDKNVISTELRLLSENFFLSRTTSAV